jgi:AcrR family transcriptional regulator
MNFIHFKHYRFIKCLKRPGKEKVNFTMVRGQAGALPASNVKGEEVAGTSTKNRSADKRTAIIDAATSLFTNEGYETTTIAEVAKKAGVAVGTVYLYFKNKQEILYAARDDWDADFAQLMGEAGLNLIPHQHRIRPLIEACFSVCLQHTERIQLMGLPPQVVGQIHMSKSTSPTMLEGIESWLSTAIQDGVFRPMDTKAAAVLSYGLVTSAMEQCFNVEGRVNQQVYIEMLVDLIERWLLRPEYLPRA